ncbi:MAG TPA: ATP-binding protein [Burkholderiales bacterium]|nr:ATP-binding protein [Burkholderiales bacterium]
MKARRVSLRSRLLYLAAAAFLPLALVSGISLLALVHQQRELAERAGIEITRALSTAVDAELSRSFAALEALGTSTLLDTGDLKRFHDRATRVIGTRSQWRSVLLHDRSGRMVLNTGYPLGAPLPQTAEGQSVVYLLREAKPAVGTLARGLQGGYSFALRVPVIRDGELRYVLSAVLSPDGIREVINRQRVPSDWVISVFDAKNQRIARSRQHEEFLGGPPAAGLLAMLQEPVHEGWTLTPTIEGDKSYAAFTRSALTGWTVAIGMPPSYVDSGALRSLVVYGGGILLSIGLAALAALLVGRGIARPMAELGAAARALGRREPLQLPDTPIAEIRQVAESLTFAADERARGEAEREGLLERERQARAIAEEANRAKDEFLAMLGHELRNPLGAIANAAQLLGAPDEESRVHARAVIGRQVQHLARMTDDLLDAARAMTGKIVLQRQPLDLAEAAARALATLRAAGRSGQRRLAQQLEPVWIDADPTRIEQVFGNLLGNALKFTPEGGTITVSVAKDGDDAVLRVTDTGIGMPPELTARVFEPFVQGERPLDRSYGGLGIGLTLVRRLAELHGGSAAAASEGPGRGSVFTVRLPAVRAPQMARQRVGAKPSTPARDVLVVEDNDDARETLKRMLELDGHRVRVAADGVSGLEAVRAAPPEIALIDIGLPKMDGYELARRIRKECDSSPDARQPYLVAVTGYGLPEDRKRTREAGFDLHVVKPVDAALLADVLERG